MRASPSLPATLPHELLSCYATLEVPIFRRACIKVNLLRCRDAGLTPGT